MRAYRIAVIAAITWLPLAHAAKTPDLRALLPGQSTVLTNVPVGFEQIRDIELWRFQPYAEDAKIFLDTPEGMRELPRSTRQFYLGRSLAGNARIALSTDANGNDLQAQVFTPSADFELRWQGDQWQLTDSKSTIPSGEALSFQCGNTPQASLAKSLVKPTQLIDTAPALDALSNALAPPTPNATLATRTATVAFDVDSNAITKKFAGSNATATSYLPTLITAMNASYDAPLNVQLLLGTTFIRTAGSDPYSGTTSTNTQLDLLGAQWRDNHASVTRAFVMLISGVQSNGCSAAGLAWVDAYCQTGTPGTSNVYGSYSANQLFHTGCANVAISNDVRITAHELGHNFGASHTHCTSIGGGAFIDSCNNGEAAFGCFAGTQSCPASGGTLMSYCHLLGGCTTSLLFHPTHISIISPKITAAFNANCIKPAVSSDLIFQNGFE
jgi:Metallo-peptidase family M12